jgi:hypothetical protein
MLSSPKAAPFLAAVVALLAAVVLDRTSPPPSADVSRGSEDVFAAGLQPREIPPRQGPQRWMGTEARFRFRNLPAGPGRLEVALHGHRTAVAVAVDGVVLGVLAPGVAALEVPIAAPREARFQATLTTEGFTTADGRRLGALVDRVTLHHAAPGWPPLALVLNLLLASLAVAWAARSCGLDPHSTLAVAAAACALEVVTLHPFGAARSAYADTVTLWLAGAALLAVGLGRALARRFPGSAPGTFAVVMIVAAVQGIAATSPLMVVSDAVFHANKLAAVAAGDLFPTSVTQHARPFRIPYGVSFYALLAPLYRLGFGGVGLVRAGAAAGGILASLALYRLLLPLRGAWAAAAVLMLQLLPGVFDVYSFGNLSNAFGQAMTVLFFAWWAGAAPGSMAVGAVLLFLGATAHLSSLIVLAVLSASLLVLGGAEARRDGRRLPALLLGLGMAALYYVHFLGMVMEQAPRLLEGGGQGRGPFPGFLGVLRAQVLGGVGQWGVPAMLLAWLGRPRTSASVLDRATRAYWVAGAVLLVPAVLTPLDVRYLYALTCPLAVAAGAGLVRLLVDEPGGWRQWAGAGLLAAQAAIAVRGLLEALLARYRP